MSNNAENDPLVYADINRFHIKAKWTLLPLSVG